MHEQAPVSEGHHLLVGLGSLVASNPTQTARLLLSGSSTSNKRHGHGAGELLELDWHESSSINSCDGEFVTRQNNKWACRCTRMTIDEMCQLNKASGQNRFGPQMTPSLGIGNDYIDDKYKYLLPNTTSQVREFGCKMTRKKLLQHVELMRKLRNLKYCERSANFGQLQSDCLYALEGLARDTNSWLASLLDQLARQDLLQLLSILNKALDDATREDEDFVALWGCAVEAGGLPIGTRPTLQTNKIQCSGRFKDRRRGSELSSDLSEDSGISLIVNLTTLEDEIEDAPIKRRQTLVASQTLERCLKFRSSQQFSTIIKFSCQLFQKLLNGSRLLKLDVTNEATPLSLNQLRLFARVECQKLRASLRFEWLARCMWLAFDKRDQLASEKCNLPPICATQNEDQVAYLDAVTRLMAYLLRVHFLEQALDLWIEAIGCELRKQAATSNNTKLSITIDLNDTDELQASQPEKLLKETLDFVCDELASTCSHLPRIELQFHQEEGSNEIITVLTFGDNLLDHKKAQLAKTIDAAVDHWISPKYLQIIDVINNFRSGAHVGALDQTEVPVIDQDINLIGLEICLNAHTRNKPPAHAIQLELTCRQVKLLDQLEQQLRCHLSTDINLGRLVQLNLQTLNKHLVKIVVKERLLLTKVQADELFRLMEKLGLQFDELEINIDLETAIEDYLNERWQVKQSQQPDLEQQILLADDNEDIAGPTMFDYDLPPDTEEPELGEDVQVPGEQVSGVSATIQEEDEFLQALVSNNNPNVAHLFAMSNPTGSVPLEQEQQMGRRQGQFVAPLIECRLLLERYKYLNRFMRDELGQFISDLRFLISHGLEFLIEILPQIRSSNNNETTSNNQQLEPEQLELLAEISLRAREFSLLIREALARLEQTAGRLVNSASLRANVLSRTLLEFNWLMIKLGQRRLDPLAHDGGDSNIKQLDFIQETSSWSQRLETRWDFLSSQNDLLRRELTLLLVECKRELEELAIHLPGVAATSRSQGDNDIMADFARYEHEFQVRADTLKLWAVYTKQVNRFWRLTEDFETQQVKWLNSDAKKLEYDQVVGAFEQNFVARLMRLQAEASEAYEPTQQVQVRTKYKILLENLNELKQRLDRFRCLCLPVFKFLTNKHLTREHWSKLGELLATTRNAMGSDLLSTNQVYATVAQLLEQFYPANGSLQLNTEDYQHLSQLDTMSHEATREHELSQLIANEVARSEHASKSLKSQLKSLEVSAHLDTWSDRELAMAAGRFIKLKLDPNNERVTTKAVNIDELARKLVGCHSAVRRYLKLRGQLNLDLARSLKSTPTTIDKKVVVLRPGQQQVGSAALLIEFLRLFTASWIESEARVALKFDKVKAKLTSSEQHLSEIEDLLDRAKSLQTTDLEVATREGERQLARLQRESLRMDLEREILATRQSAALERQREALRARDICIRQVSERAVPALRAATRALDCLGDGRSALRALRSYRPSPPLAVRLVIEAVCLLRNVCVGQQDTKDLANLGSPSSRQDERLEKRKNLTPNAATTFTASPERRFDAVKGQIVEDYWPHAWRTLNGIHSTQFVADLRQVSKRTIPREAMLRIRRKYLGRPEFSVTSIGRVSREAALLARWLIAVDVFDRVLNIVRPNHEEYLRAEENLAELVANVTESRQQIDTLGRELEQLEDSISVQVKRRATLVDLIEDCRQRSSQMELTRGELLEKIAGLRQELTRLQMKLDLVAQKCLWDTARLVYLDALPRADRASIEYIIKRELNT